ILQSQLFPLFKSGN
ncbi:unnamed protein product, partial [Allacma fusca]